MNLKESRSGTAGGAGCSRGWTWRLRPATSTGCSAATAPGKTTLLNLMSGLLFPKAGSARVAGEEVRRRTPAFLRELYFVPEEFHTPALSARALVRLYGVFYPRFDHAAMERYLAELEIDPEQRMTAMSYGQKKKVLLAFAVASGCRLLLLDEPTNGLDIPAKSQFRRLLAGAATDDRVIVVSTHQVRDLEHLIDPILILDQGSIVFQHTVEEISAALAVREAGAAGSAGNGHAIYVEFGSGAGGAHAGRALVPAERGGPMSESAIDLELLFNSVCADHRRVEAAFADATTDERSE